LSGTSSTTVKVRVSYLGALRHRMGCKEEAVTVGAPATVRTVLEHLISLHGSDLRDVFFNDQYGWVDSRLLVIIDGECGVRRTGGDVILTGAEEFQLLLGSPISGG